MKIEIIILEDSLANCFKNLDYKQRCVSLDSILVCC